MVHEESQRKQIIFTAQALDDTALLMDTGKFSSESEMVRHAVAFMRKLKEVDAGGGRTYFVHEDGTEERVCFV